MRRIVLIAALLLVAVRPVAAQPKDDLIYPRGSAPAGAPAAAEPGGYNSTLLLATAALALAAGWWLWQKRRVSAAFGGAATRRLSVVESRSLGSRQYLVVADYDGRKFLLGVCPGSIELLAPLDGPNPPPTP